MFGETEMAKRKILFDWSSIDRNSLLLSFLDLQTIVLRQHFTVSKIHSILANCVKSNYPIRVRKLYSNHVEKGVIYIGGMYFSDLDKTKKKCIEIQFFYNNPKDSIFIDSKRLKRLGTCFADTLLHEIIHMRQFRRRNFKFLPEYASNAEKTEQRSEQSYLGSSDEIDAYGFNIACELLEKFNGNQQKIVKYLDQNQKYKKLKYNSWRMYLKAFDHNHNHEIIKRLKKKVIRYLPHAEIGKPYKNKDWIAY